MTRKKKILCGSFIAFLLVVLFAYVAASVALDRFSRRLMSELVTKAETRGIGLSQPSFESARLSPFLSPIWSGIAAKLSRSPDESSSEWDLQADRATLHWKFDNRAFLIARGVTLFDISAGPRGREMTDRQIIVDHISYQIPFDLWHPKSVIPALLQEFEQLSSEGTTSWPLGIDGVIVCKVKSKPVELDLEVVQRGNVNSLALMEEGVASLSDLFEDKLTETEVELIASYPLRAARLLQIKDTAESTSTKANQKDSSVPQDAYRHVLWSYLLTQAYDAKFAEEVGNAHETGDTGNTEAEREMDLHNNSIGRKYAKQGIKQAGVLKQLMSDPEVQHAP
ncbi:DUF6973 domain-containing protein [Bythopirellula polymerisocia]|uniref:DUF6973 domain-containing protein n=1 Tax=Bythopirellula polymerisocia TaxID=2528003 RepID=UPI0011B76BA6|nr:hypothetical protein [Bythopirellula polymerisocia]